ncbi:hypothetical protein AVEN_270017-1 [Araneus ventricosus]|uniref:Uncharacterized protein n=1 Tax=Araneus ventricosus TaxID=182803 RepID=A0A4Y2H475_ARAVE|nr:hypothetical protein AVEN_270017-1 [Araneus ventricosus]
MRTEKRKYKRQRMGEAVCVVCGTGWGEADHVTFPSKPPLPCVVHRRVSLRRDRNTTPVFATVKPAATDYRLHSPPQYPVTPPSLAPPSVLPPGPLRAKGIDSVRRQNIFTPPPFSIRTLLRAGPQ